MIGDLITRVTSGDGQIIQDDLLPLLIIAGVCAILVLAGWFASGIVSFTYWVAHYGNAKKIANLGLVISLVAFSTQLIEPLVNQINSQSDQPVLIALSWSPTGDYIASIMGNGTVQIWNPGDGATVAQFHDPTGAVSSVAWDPGFSNTIASADQSGNIHIWSATQGDNDNNSITLTTPSLSPNQAAVQAMAWSADGNYLAAARQGDSSVQVWDLSQDKPKSTMFNFSNCQSANASVSADTYVNALTWSNGPEPGIVTGATNGTITSCAWDRNKDAASHPFVYKQSNTGNAVNYLNFTTAGLVVANEGSDSTGNNNTLVWQAYAVDRLPQMFQTDYAQAWSPDGNAFAQINSKYDSSNETVFIEPLKTTFSGTTPKVSVLRNFAQVTAVAWSADGAYLATGSSDGTVQVWIIGNGSHLSMHKYKG